ncbi:helix-hairpin-helix domain-containing protein [Paenibacillus guangzhouensis]|uniref:hypothetical protein n=1 Tax=Paenibacillus guangzhouensis TaxID=1473112 RepID=UPI001266A75E|nr:hypothetical protein [Paenibacillus guangzhouensis]
MNKKLTSPNDIPSGLSQPALRALAHAGLTNLEQISKLTLQEFKNLHGIGPTAVKPIVEAMEAKGLFFSK